MLNHTTLLFAPNLCRIKWNVTKFALIITQKPLIIAQFYISFLHLQLLFVSFVALWVVCGLLKTPEINCKCFSHLIWDQRGIDIFWFWGCPNFVSPPLQPISKLNGWIITQPSYTHNFSKTKTAINNRDLLYMAGWQQPHSPYKMDERFAKSTMNSNSVVF